MPLTGSQPSQPGLEIGSRRRHQPAPPRVLFEALANTADDRGRPWLVLLADECLPTVVQSDRPRSLVLSSIWRSRPDARIELELPPSADGGTDLRWALFVGEPPPSEAMIGHMRKRLNELINRDLRYSCGQ